VQRTAGLVIEFGPNHAYVVTSSQFTNNAYKSANQLEHENTLIDGDTLRELLNESSLIPPNY